MSSQRAFMLSCHEAPDEISTTSTTLAGPSCWSLNFTTQNFPHPEVADEGLGKRVFTVSSSSLWLNLSQNSKSSALFSSMHAVFTKSCAAACGYLPAGPLLCPDPKEEAARRRPTTTPAPTTQGGKTAKETLNSLGTRPAVPCTAVSIAPATWPQGRRVFGDVLASSFSRRTTFC